MNKQVQNDDGSGEPPRLVVYALADSARFARRLARALDAPLAPIRLHRFPDRETLVRVAAAPGADAVVVQSFDDPDPKLMPVLLAADGLRRAGARRVTLVAPYLAYMRQDRVFHPGEPISQRVFGEALGHAFDRVLTLEAHLHRVRRLAEVMPGRARSLSAAPVIAEWLRRRGAGTLAVGPDEESAPWIKAVARAAGVPWAVGTKRRLGDRNVRIHFAALPRCDRAVAIDDVASSGATLAAAIRGLREHGVRTVDAAVVHAIFAPGALSAIRRAGARAVVSCDTIEHPTNAIRCAGLLAAALTGAHEQPLRTSARVTRASLRMKGRTARPIGASARFTGASAPLGENA
jgi:ribose-phosphate pyrophosphokinase